jgi:hypothetical protein
MVRHRHQEYLALLTQLSWAYFEQGLRLVMDNYAVHKTLIGVGLAG